MGGAGNALKRHVCTLHLGGANRGAHTFAIRTKCCVRLWEAMSLYLLLSVLFLGELGEDMFNLATDMLSVCDRHFRFSHSSSCTGVAQYRWDCTAPNDAGQRYIPSERDRNVETAVTDGNTLLSLIHI